jgi:two-component system response regulator DctR
MGQSGDKTRRSYTCRIMMFSPAPEIANASRTVFIVDDDDAHRESLLELVSTLKIEVRPFASAEEFLASYDPSQRGCLIVDYRMVGMNGLQLQERVHAFKPPLPVIMVSGYADVAITVRAMQLGAVTDLEKPYRPEELIHAENLAQVQEVKLRQSWDEYRDVTTRLQSLSQEELEVMNRLIAGVPNKLIASELDLGLRTVERRRRVILRRMGCEAVPELAARLAKREMYLNR